MRLIEKSESLMVGIDWKKQLPSSDAARFLAINVSQLPALWWDFGRRIKRRKRDKRENI